MLAKFVTKVIGSKNKRVLKQLNQEVQKINSSYQFLLKEKNVDLIIRLRKTVAEKKVNHSFAIIKILIERTLGLKAYDVQLLGALSINKQLVAEIKTGEGKTLTGLFPIIYQSLSGKQVHVISANRYLAKRDQIWSEKLFASLNLTSDYHRDGKSIEDTVALYNNQIIYGTVSDFGFDYLRKNLINNPNNQFDIKFDYALIDEADAVMIDQAKTPLIITSEEENHLFNYEQIDKQINLFNVYLSKVDEHKIDESMYHAILNPIKKEVELTESGFKLAETIFSSQGWVKNENKYDGQYLYLYQNIKNALLAHFCYHLNKDYIINTENTNQSQIVIIDQYTGRLLPGQTWMNGLHQAIEAKEKVKVFFETKEIASISIQNFLSQYQSLSGMSGTVDSDSFEFYQIYGLETLVIPTNKPMQRLDHGVKLYATKKGKYSAALNDIIQSHQKGQPLLIVVKDIDDSIDISNLLKQNAIEHKLLNSNYHEQEAEIIAQAGKLNAVTVSTTMSGRGTDIMLGGSPHGNEDLAISQHENKLQVAQSGGLKIIALDKFNSLRVDNQMIGRAGRQGEVGESVFYISLEDELFNWFKDSKILKMVKLFGVNDNEALMHASINEAIVKIQEKINYIHYKKRKQIKDFDDILNSQRKIFYAMREQVLNGNTSLSEEWISYGIYQVIKTYDKNNSLEEINHYFTTKWKIKLPIVQILEKDHSSSEQIFKEIHHIIIQFLTDKKLSTEKKNYTNTIRSLTLISMDKNWFNYQTQSKELQKNIYLRSYAQVKPLEAFIKESHEQFTAMLESIKEDFCMAYFNFILNEKN